MQSWEGAVSASEAARRQLYVLQQQWQDAIQPVPDNLRDFARGEDGLSRIDRDRRW